MVALVVVQQGANAPCICAAAAPKPTCLGDSYITALHPGRAKGKQFQSYMLCMASYADIVDQCKMVA
jgi:hypothetical protein